MQLNPTRYNGNTVEVTDFFYAADRTRAEQLAQPECHCGNGECGCPAGESITNCNNRDDKKTKPKADSE